MATLSDAELQQPRENQYEVALAGVADAVIVVDSNYAVTYLNPAAAHLIGRPAADILGQPLAGVLRITRDTRADEGIGPESLFEALRQGRKKIDLVGDTSLLSPGGVRVPIGSSLAQAERWLIEATLAHWAGNKNRAAKMLGCSLKTLYNKLATYERQSVEAHALSS